MPKRIRLRSLTTDERAEVQRLATSRRESIRLVQRARIIAAMAEDPELTATEAGFKAGFRSNIIQDVLSSGIFFILGVFSSDWI